MRVGLGLTLDERSIGKDGVRVVASNHIDQRSRVCRERGVDRMVVGQDDLKSDELAIDYLVVLMNLWTDVSILQTQRFSQTYHVDMSPVVLSDLARSKIISFDFLHVATERVRLFSDLHADIEV